MTEVTSKRCNTCGIEKPFSELVANKRSAHGYMPMCKPCRNQYWKDHRSGNEDARKRHIQTVLRSKMLKAYGLTPHDYENLVREQGDRCKLCGSSEHGRNTRFRSWNVDHCHKSGAVRGLLCNSCNTSLGHYEKLVDQFGRARLEDYLNGHPPQGSDTPA